MKDFEQLEKEHSLLMKLFFYTVDCRKGQNLTENNLWLYEAEVLASKLFFHLGSIRFLWQGTKLAFPKDGDHIYIDHSSITVIVRAAFETYLTYYFIYCDMSANQNEKKLRHTIWKLRGLLDRQNFSAISEEGAQKLENEKNVINELLSDIEKNQYYKALSEKLQKSAKKGEWRLGKHWVELARIAGFHTEIFRDTYSYLCSYAHSGGLSALQIGQAIGLSDQRKLSKISIHYSLILISHFIKSYRKLFREINEKLKIDNESEALSNKWFITWKEPEFLKPFSHNKRLHKESV